MSSASTSPNQTISLPKDGAALSGIGEKFSPDLHTGTGNFSVPIALPPGRNGFQPQLTLAYSTGNGSGPFGLGWSLSVPEVSRLGTLFRSKAFSRVGSAIDRAPRVCSHRLSAIRICLPIIGKCRARIDS